MAQDSLVEDVCCMLIAHAVWRPPAVWRIGKFQLCRQITLAWTLFYFRGGAENFEFGWEVYNGIICIVTPSSLVGSDSIKFLS